MKQIPDYISHLINEGVEGMRPQRFVAVDRHIQTFNQSPSRLQIADGLALHSEGGAESVAVEIMKAVPPAPSEGVIRATFRQNSDAIGLEIVYGQ